MTTEPALKSPTPSSSAATTDRGTSESNIDRDSHFNGLYRTKQNLRIEGVAEGEIQCDGTLTVVQGARVKAKVAASTITIAGELEGEVVCRGVFQIMPSGQVEATVSARRLNVQEGGFYNGEFHMITDDSTLSELSRSLLEHKATEPEQPKLATLSDKAAPQGWQTKATGVELPQSDSEQKPA